MKFSKEDLDFLQEIVLDMSRRAQKDEHASDITPARMALSKYRGKLEAISNKISRARREEA